MIKKNNNKPRSKIRSKCETSKKKDINFLPLYFKFLKKFSNAYYEVHCL